MEGAAPPPAHRMPDLIRCSPAPPPTTASGAVWVFLTSRGMADDGEVIELVAPLPGLARRATIRFLSGGEGLLKRSKPTSRVEADHAVLELDLGDRTDERRLELTEVEPYLAEVRAFQAAVAAKRAENLAEQRTPEEHAAARAERSARIRPSCPYCGVPREHRGRRNVATVADPTRLTRAGAGVSSLGLEPVELYACPSCGSIELFAVGHVDHPLA